MIAGIVTENTGLATVCRVELFTDELKAEIRDRLAAICHGKDKVAAGSIVASYRETLRDFLTRYANKTEDTRKGMIGELLTHILLLKAFPDYEPANPYFNMEEGSIKKGFDLIVFDESEGELRIVEVKSGGAGNRAASTANKALLNTAKNDLKDRLNDTKTHIWLNAINGAKLAMTGGKIKDEINRILEECYAEAAQGDPDSTSKNVILVSVLYEDTADPISIESADEKAAAVIEEGYFKDTTVFSIQKETWEHIVDFLEEEAAA
tara:strand:+ start:4514 stop:5308 length:795 start_codon:yes stop_codon:yes gene_type:complete